MSGTGIQKSSNTSSNSKHRIAHLQHHLSMLPMEPTVHAISSFVPIKAINTKTPTPVSYTSSAEIQHGPRQMASGATDLGATGMTERLQTPSPFPEPPTMTPNLQELWKHPILRPVRYRHTGSKLPLHSNDGGQYTINYEAAGVQERGTLQPKECTACGYKARPGGPFVECVAMAGFVQGACANCWSNKNGSRCSFRDVAKPPGTSLSKRALTAIKETPQRRSRKNLDSFENQVLAFMKLTEIELQAGKAAYTRGIAALEEVLYRKMQDELRRQEESNVESGEEDDDY